MTYVVEYLHLILVTDIYAYFVLHVPFNSLLTLSLELVY